MSLAVGRNWQLAGPPQPRHSSARCRAQHTNKSEVGGAAPWDKYGQFSYFDITFAQIIWCLAGLSVP